MAGASSPDSAASVRGPRAPGPDSTGDVPATRAGGRYSAPPVMPSDDAAHSTRGADAAMARGPGSDSVMRDVMARGTPDGGAMRSVMDSGSGRFPIGAGYVSPTPSVGASQQHAGYVSPTTSVGASHAGGVDAAAMPTDVTAGASRSTGVDAPALPDTIAMAASRYTPPHRSTLGRSGQARSTAGGSTGQAAPRVGRSSGRSSPTVGTAFSRAAKFWTRRERLVTPTRVQTAMLQASVESELRKVSQAAAQEAEATRQAAQTALESVRSLQEEGRRTSSQLADEVARLQRTQHQHQADVMTLGSRVEEVKKEADYVGTKADLTARTQQTAQSQELERRLLETQQKQHAAMEDKLREQTVYLNDVVQQLRAALDDSRAATDLKMQQVTALESALSEERRERQELQRFVEDVEASLAQGTYSDAALGAESEQLQDITVTQDEFGLPLIPGDYNPTVPLIQHDRMQKPAAPVLSLSQPAPPVEVKPPVQSPLLRPPPIPVQPPSLPPPSIPAQPTPPAQPPVPPPVDPRGVQPLQQPIVMFPAAQMRPKEPSSFRGEVNEDLDAWLSQTRDYCHLMGTREEQNVAYAATLLQGHARVWWDGLLRQRGGVRPATLDELAQLLRGRFLSPMQEKNARTQLWAIAQRQGESVHAFSNRFLNLLQKLRTYDQEDMLERYIRALRPELRLVVAQRDPTSLERAMYIGEHLELLTASYVGKSSGQTTQSTSGQSQSQGQATRANQQQGSGQRGRRNQWRGRRSGQQQQQRQQPVQPQTQRPQQYQGGNRPQVTCNYCGKFGHYMKDCYSNPQSANYRGARQQPTRPQGTQARGQPVQRGGARVAALTPAGRYVPQQQGPPAPQHTPGTPGNAVGPTQGPA